MTPAATAPLVLIADENIDTREMYALYRSMAGYNVDTAGDGHEAVVKGCAMRPDIIVMDLQMPKLDGWGAIKELRGSGRPRPFPSSCSRVMTSKTS